MSSNVPRERVVDAIMDVAAELREKPGVEMVAPFGNTLHVTGTDAAKLAGAVKAVQREGLRVRQVDPTLEDVFIHLMRDLNESARPRREAAH